MFFIQVRDTSTENIYILMEARLEALYKKADEYVILEKFLGETLFGKTYEPLFPYFAHVSHDAYFAHVSRDAQFWKTLFGFCSSCESSVNNFFDSWFKRIRPASFTDERGRCISYRMRWVCYRRKWYRRRASISFLWSCKNIFLSVFVVACGYLKLQRTGLWKVVLKSV